MTMAGSLKIDSININKNGEPTLSRSYALKMIGDWGGANFHRICACLTQDFCDRTGPERGISIWSLCDGSLDGITQVEMGEADLAIATPTGKGFFAKPMPHLRALGTLPQNDRLVLAIHPRYQIETFEDLRRQKPALRVAASTNDGTNFIGYVSSAYMDAHGISKATLESWGGRFVTAHRPEQCVALVENGEADALLQEAIMTPWWRGLIESNQVVPIPAEPQALQFLETSLGIRVNSLQAGFWDTLVHDLPALDFSDFVVFLRDDMPK